MKKTQLRSWLGYVEGNVVAHCLTIELPNAAVNVVCGLPVGRACYVEKAVNPRLPIYGQTLGPTGSTHTETSLKGYLYCVRALVA